MIVGGIAFVLIVVGLFVLVYVNKNNAKEDAPVEDQTPTENPYGITRIDAKHFYIDGTHTVAGEIDMPTPCDLLDGQATVAESMPEQVTIDFNVINTSETCVQAITPQRFKVSFDASAEAVIKARFMGQEVELNLVPAGEGETPEDFELYLKG